MVFILIVVAGWLLASGWAFAVQYGMESAAGPGNKIRFPDRKSVV